MALSTHTEAKRFCLVGTTPELKGTFFSSIGQSVARCAKTIERCTTGSLHFFWKIFPQPRGARCVPTCASSYRCFANLAGYLPTLQMLLAGLWRHSPPFAQSCQCLHQGHRQKSRAVP